jgi:hypothetical protein
MRTSGACATCGHIGGLPGLDEQRRPTCRSCSGISLPLDYPRCGAEGQLYRAGTCIRCALGDDVYLLLGGPKGIIPTPLLPLVEAIKTMPSARSGTTWLQSPKVKGLLPEGSRPIVVRWSRVGALERPDLWTRGVAINLAHSAWSRQQVVHRAGVTLRATATVATTTPDDELQEACP